jgi:CspA family cold shock protein
MSTGLVKFFNEAKGFGFIKEDDNDTEHFVHVSGLIDRITEGDKVEFELKEVYFGMILINLLSLMLI